MHEVRITAMTMGDVDRLSALAADIWRHHYAGIISTAQIEYMLAQRYGPSQLRVELTRRDLWWDQLLIAGVLCGFSSYFINGTAGEMKLDKLYVHHHHQRNGYGRMLVDRAATIARSYGCVTLALAVNKHNRNAIAAYRKYGFNVVESVVKDIGSGFVMDDYVMIRSI